METSISLATESFSHSWLTSTRFFIEDQDDDPARTSLYLHDEDTLDDTDRKIEKSKRFLGEPLDPNFNFHSSGFPLPLIHADEIFSNGKILPMYHEKSKEIELKILNSMSLISSITQLRNNSHHGFLVKWRKSSKKVFCKYLGLLKPLCSKLGCSREGVKVGDFDRKVWEMSSLDNSPQTSPPQRRDLFVGEWFDVMVKRGYESDDFERNLRKAKSWSHFSPQFNSAGEWSAESSIYEAILYCKRSCEK